MSILDNRPALQAEIDKVAEVALYLWTKGWAERNGGNITVNITEWVDDGMRAKRAISDPRPIGAVLPHLEGCWFYCKGTGKRMRDLARDPMGNGSIIRLLPDCAHYEIVADAPVAPTSELPSHLAVHDYLLKRPACELTNTENLKMFMPTYAERIDELQKQAAQRQDMVPRRSRLPEGIIHKHNR